MSDPSRLNTCKPWTGAPPLSETLAASPYPIVRLIGRLGGNNRLLDGAIGLMVGALTWPVANTSASIGIDPSWIVGLHMAARNRLPFGSEISFTFGPLGYLGFPEPYLGWTSALALVFVGLVHFAMCVAMFYLACQSIGRPKALVLVLGVAFAFPWIAGWPTYGVLIFFASVAAVLRRTQQPSGLYFAVVLGAAVGFGGLGKLNVAIVSAGIAGLAVTTTARDWRASVGVFAVSSIAVFVGLWLVLGQSIGDLPSYARSAFEFSVGYGESMGMLDPNTNWVSGVAVLATALLAGMVWQRSAGLPRRDQAVLWAILAVMVFAAYKGGFTRAGVGTAIFISTLLALWPVVSPRASSWVTAATPVIGMAAAFLAVIALPVATLVDPIDRLKALGHEAVTVATDRSGAVARNSASLRAQYGLPPEATDLLTGKTVDIEPWEAAVAYAYPGINWRPQPVFQAYSAYTTYLDTLNANFLASNEAPERMLWLTPPATALSIDWRSFWFDSPAAKVEMLCRYTPLAATSNWQVLGLEPDRCSAPISVATLTVAAGEAVALPANLPKGIVTLRVSGAGSDLLTRLITLAYESPPWYVIEDGSTFRLPIGTANDPMVIGATTDLGYSQALALGPPPDTIIVGPNAGTPGFGSPLTLTIEVVPLEH